MGTAIGWLAAKSLFGKPIGEGPARWILTAALFLAILGVAAGTIAALKQKGATDYVQKVEKRAAPATNKASDERARDAITNAKAEQEMHDVIAAQPDQPIAPTSHARGCEQLRRAGRHPASCGGPAGGH